MHDIFDLLLDAQLISESTVKVVQRFCKKWMLSGFHGLLETNIFDEVQLADILAQRLTMDRVYTLMQQESGALARKMIPYDIATRWECFPNMIKENGHLEIIIADPTQRQWVEYFRKNLGSQFNLAVGTRSDIVRAIDEYYPLHEQLPFLQVKK